MAVGSVTATFCFTDDDSTRTIPVRETPLGSLYRGVLDGEEVIIDVLLREVISHECLPGRGECRPPKWTRSIADLTLEPQEAQHARAS